MARPVIPQEIIDHIIDGYEGLPRLGGTEEDAAGLVREDRQLFGEWNPRCIRRPLTRFSLVARNWLPRSRYHLFSAPVVRINQDKYNSLRRLLDTPQKALGSIGPFIRHVTISSPCPSIFLPSYFPVLEELTLQGSLTLRQVQALMLSIPTLRKVGFKWVKLAIPPMEEEVARGKHPSVDTLRTIDTMSTSLQAFTWLDKVKPAHAISTLRVSGLYPDQIGNLSKFLASMASSLQHLEISSLRGSAIGDCETSLARGLNLGRLKQLESLTLPTVSLLTPEEINNLDQHVIHAVDFLIVMLRTLPASSKLKTLTISANEGDLAHFPWEDLATTLCRNSFAALESLVFVDWTVKDEARVPEVEAFINQCLSRIAARGILKIQFENLDNTTADL
ncbi:hypothetical protein LshimejAT787_0112100 [Lyophyllum shimeji]|uniref:Uncharacterized protein n=1 Tax=Lyophyllum shimeji TaxID=47721 RepID=A0A9P3PEC8_LYOSH|nr:hypothetical protein LshimejAT787_0112100 [Lyophyllum shimeji]